MPLKKILFRPGVNRENTRYASEALGSINSGTQSVGGWYESDKVRFRAGTPETIGGWVRISSAVFAGICRSLWAWVTLASIKLTGVGTNLKFYIENSGVYNDITPIRSTVTLTNPFTATLGSSVITVADTAHGAIGGDFVTFSGAAGLGGVITASVLNQEYEITYIDADSYTIDVGVNANATDVSGSPGGGSGVVAQYQINIGPGIQVPLTGWGAGGWGAGSWGVGAGSVSSLRLWSQANFGEDLVFSYRGGPIYYWNASEGISSSSVSITIATPAVLTLSVALAENDVVMLTTTGALPTGLSVGTVYYATNVSGFTCNLATTPGGAEIDTTGTQSGVHSLSTRGVPLDDLAGASDVPTIQNFVFVSDASRFIFAFGCNDYGSTAQNPMLIRWSDQESVTEWTPAATNQAGSLQLSHGSEIVTAIQARQEIVVFTDSSVYSLQYQGPPAVWGSQLLGDNISILGQNAAAFASGVTYWMGVDKFYKYDGRVQTLRCDLRQYIYSDINLEQNQQVFAGTNEGFNEIWWFYCSANSTVIDKYVVYNYLEDIWYYGTLGRTAWLDSGINNFPLAATYNYNLVDHETGVDNDETGTPAAINAYISSSEFDIDDGHNFGFVYRILPDLTFRGSTSGTTPQLTITLIPMANSGSGFNSPQSEGGSSNATVARTATVPIEEFTGQVFVRVRGRQMIFEVESDRIGTAWQLGAPRIDIKPDGRRGNS